MYWVLRMAGLFHLTVPFSFSIGGYTPCSIVQDYATSMKSIKHLFTVSLLINSHSIAMGVIKGTFLYEC